MKREDRERLDVLRDGARHFRVSPRFANDLITLWRETVHWSDRLDTLSQFRQKHASRPNPHLCRDSLAFAKAVR
ncbi:MAG: hypothetical protein ACK5IP_22015 [Paracoccus sp. (in: a-proteobacteria)]